MFEAVKKLFGGGASQPEAQPPFVGSGPASGQYFAPSEQIDGARKAGDFHRAIAAVHESFPLLAAFVRETKRSFGRWDIQSSVSVHTGATLMAVMGDRAGIAEFRSTLEATPEFRAWLGAVNAAEADADLVDLVMEAVAREPGLVQTALKIRTGQEDGRRPSPRS
jgi:hypothetical protein